jgi:hypothetical protein
VASCARDTGSRSLVGVPIRDERRQTCTSD